MGEEWGDSLAGVALDVHVEGVRALNDALELVGLGFLEGGGVQDIDGESHFCCCLLCEVEV